MNGSKNANASLTHAKIVNEYENKVWSLKRENKRLKAYKDKIENARYALKIQIYSLEKALDKKPDKVKQAQLQSLLEIQGELK